MSYIEEEYLERISYNFPLFKKTKSGTYNCRCPFCGDSKKSKTAKHGYFYTKGGKLFYKCFKCRSTTFDKILKELEPDLYLEYKLEKLDNKPRLTLQKDIERKQEKKHKDTKIDIISLKDLDKDHIAKKYVMNRRIPLDKWNRIFYIDDIKKISSKLSEYKDIKFPSGDFLVFKFIKNNRLTHIQFRNLNPISKNFRYITLEFIETDKLYGWDYIDENKPIKVVEGPIDSLFLSNCVGMSGLTCNSNSLEGKDVTFIFDNEPRNKWVVRSIERIIDEGHKICILDGIANEEEDINDLVKRNIPLTEIENYIDNNSFDGLRAMMKLNEWKRV